MRSNNASKSGYSQYSFDYTISFALSQSLFFLPGCQQIIQLYVSALLFGTTENIHTFTISIYSKASLCVPTSEAYWPFLANSSKWVPNSAILPSEQTAIWYAFCTVLNRWAITKVVLPFINWLRASWTKRSLTASRALVACTSKECQKSRHAYIGSYQGFKLWLFWSDTSECSLQSRLNAATDKMLQLYCVMRSTIWNNGSSRYQQLKEQQEKF